MLCWSESSILRSWYWWDPLRIRLFDMTEFYDRMGATATRLIRRFGFAITLEKPGVTTGPAWAPVAGPPTTHSLVAIDQNIQHRDQTGTLIGTSSRVLLVEATGVVPAKADRVQVRGVWHEIVDVMPEAPGGIDLVYSLTLGT